MLLGDRLVVMTARPGRVAMDRKIPLLRPRHLDMETAGEFLELKQAPRHPRTLRDQKHRGFSGCRREERTLAVDLANGLKRSPAPFGKKNARDVGAAKQIRLRQAVQVKRSELRP